MDVQNRNSSSVGKDIKNWILYTASGNVKWYSNYEKAVCELFTKCQKHNHRGILQFHLWCGYLHPKQPKEGIPVGIWYTHAHSSIMHTKGSVQMSYVHHGWIY